MSNANSSSCCDNLRESIPWLVNGTLSDGEAIALRKHILDCSECRADLEVHESMQASVLERDIEPLLPGTTADDVLGRPVQSTKIPSSRFPRQWFAIAAGVAALGVALTVSFLAGKELQNDNRVFETATSNGSTTSVDYVLQIRFDTSLAAPVRQQMTEDLPGATKWIVNDDGAVDVFIQLMSPSFADLQDYEDRVGAMAGVESAEFTALQLPMK